MIAKKVHRLDFVEGIYYIYTSVRTVKSYPEKKIHPAGSKREQYYRIVSHMLGCHDAILVLLAIFVNCPNVFKIM